MARIKINCDGVDSANLILNSVKNSITTNYKLHYD